MRDGSYVTDDGWTFTVRRNDGRETYRVTWRSPEGARGIIRDKMTVEGIETFSPEAFWAQGVAEFKARLAS